MAEAMNELAKIDPPRAWPKAEKARFKLLPYDLQVYFAAHEDKRDKEIRRAQNEAANARQKLKALQDITLGKTDANIEIKASA